MKVIINESQFRLLMESISFEDVYKETYPIMFRQVCMKYAKGDEDLAKEYCQLGYIRVNENLHKFSGSGSIGGWVRRVINNTIINELRKTTLDTSSDVDFERLDIEDTTYDINPDFFEGKLTASQIRRAVSELPEGYAKIITLYYFEDLSHDEIADLLNINPGTSRSQLFKGKKLLKGILYKYLTT